MSDLPARDEFRDMGNMDKHDYCPDIANAWLHGELLSRAEWEATIDRTALYEAFNEMESDVTLAQYQITDRLIAAIEGGKR